MLLQKYESSELKRKQQETILLQYEGKIQQLQESIQQLEKENQQLKLLSTLERNLERKIYQPSSNGNSNINNSLQKRTPPSSARRLLQGSTLSSPSPSNSQSSIDDVNGLLESPRLVLRTPSARFSQRLGPPGSAHDSRRHSSYTTGDYIVSYDMRESIDDPLNSTDEIPQKPFEKISIDPIPEKQHQQKPQKSINSSHNNNNNNNQKIGIDFIPGVELTTHPYYPHSAAASMLWQESVIQQVLILL